MQHETGVEGGQSSGDKNEALLWTKEEPRRLSEVGTSPAQWASLIKLTSLKT